MLTLIYQLYFIWAQTINHRFDYMYLKKVKVMHRYKANSAYCLCLLFVSAAGIYKTASSIIKKPNDHVKVLRMYVFQVKSSYCQVSFANRDHSYRIIDMIQLY